MYKLKLDFMKKFIIGITAIIYITVGCNSGTSHDHTDGSHSHAPGETHDHSNDSLEKKPEQKSFDVSSDTVKDKDEEQREVNHHHDHGGKNHKH